MILRLIVKTLLLPHKIIGKAILAESKKTRTITVNEPKNSYDSKTPETEGQNSL